MAEVPEVPNNWRCGNEHMFILIVYRGYHVYQVLWQPQIRDSFIAVHEEGNTHHKYAMAVYRSEEPTVVIGHLLREIAKACYYFLKHNGRITGVVPVVWTTCACEGVPKNRS